jgi:hypothetical protein
MISRIVDPDYGDITELVMEELRGGILAKEMAAARLQRAVAEAAPVQAYNRQLGTPVMQIHPSVYWHWVGREGVDCWGDKGFRRDLLRDNPDLAPRVEKPQDRICLDGHGADIWVGSAPVGKRYTKTYA